MRVPLLLLVAAGLLTACTTPLHAAGGGRDLDRRLDSDGRRREYLVHLPPDLRPGAPLLVALHGGLGTGAIIRDYSGFDAIADREGFVVAYPSGIRRGWADGRGASAADEKGVDDVAFIARLVERLLAAHGLDPRRVFVVGHSNGGFMAQRVAAERADLVAGIATVGSSMSEALAARFRPSAPVSVLMINGTEDPWVPYGGGMVRRERGRVLAAETSIARWVAADGCDPTPAVTTVRATPDDGTRLVASTWTGCRNGHRVALYTVEGGGHGWLGLPLGLPERVLGPQSHAIQSSEAIWRFFRDVRP